MIPKDVVLTRDQMALIYGTVYLEYPHVAIKKERVPQSLWPLIPYAQFWGIADDAAREGLVRSLPREVLDNLVSVVRAFDDYLDDWLSCPEASSGKPSREYIAFSAMRMAADCAC